MNLTNDSHERRLRTIAQGLSYPATPDIARSVRQKLTKVPRSSFPQRRVALAAVALIIILLAGVLSVPGVRAAVIEFLQIGVIRIILPVPTSTPLPELPGSSSPTTNPVPTQTALPSVKPRDLIDLDDLGGETTLEAAIQKASFILRLPTFPADLGQPERVFVQDLGGDMVILVWTEEGNPENAELVLFEIAPGSWAGEKGDPTSIENTRVNGLEAIWVEGPYSLKLTYGDLDLRRLVAGRTLIWEENEVTYRLESHMSLDQAIDVAESLKPIP